jgi:hypothetical protein
MNMNSFELQDLNFHLCHAISLNLNFEVFSLESLWAQMIFNSNRLSSNMEKHKILDDTTSCHACFMIVCESRFNPDSKDSSNKNIAMS